MSIIKMDKNVLSEKITEYIPMVWIMLQIHYTTHIVWEYYNKYWTEWFCRCIIFVFNLRNKRMNVYNVLLKKCHCCFL
jgi:hypothetical protein